jgi:trimeric autotransporter adhesin
MSTKTTFKRIALVAVAALGLGVLSVAPSSAAAISEDTHTIAFAAGGTTASAAITAGESATVAVKTGFVNSAAYADTLTIKANVIDAPAGGLTTPVMMLLSDSATSAGVIAGTSVSTADADASTGMALSGSAAATINATYSISLYAPTVAGTYTVRIYSVDSAGAWSPAPTPLTFTVTVTAANTTAAANSVSVLRPYGNTVAQGTAATDSTVVASRSAATTVTAPQGSIFVTLNNATSTASESLTATVSGPATLGTSTSARGTSTALTVAYTGADTPIYVWANGTAGAATVTVRTVSGLTIKTHTVNFVGPRTAIAIATDPKPQTNVRAGGKTLAAMDVTLKDAVGMPVIGAASTLSCVIANPLVIAGCTFADNADGSYTVTLTSASGSTSGQTTTVTVRTTDPAVTTSTAYISAAAATVTTASTANKYTITTDKASYTPGEQMIVTVTAVDATGNPVHDGASVPTLSSNKTVNGLANVASTFVAGKADSIARDSDGTVTSTYRVFAPSTSGSFDIYADYTDTALASQRATVSATVADPALDAAADAANEATDAANAATDAALAAADAADAATAAAQDASDAVAALSASVSKLISSLRAQITSLTNLVIKIQKKVRA